MTVFSSPRLGARLAVLAFASLMAVGCVRDEHAGLDPAKIERGRDLFMNCAACHNIRKRENNVGPHLVGILDRKAATARGYEYSDGMRGAGLTWTPETLRRFLNDPQATVPGTNMVIETLSPEDAEAIVQYLQSRE